MDLYAVRRAIHLFFSTMILLTKVEYHCIFKILWLWKVNFADLLENFSYGSFVFHQTARKGSGIPMD